MSNGEKFTKVCCVCSVTGHIPECECVCHGSAAEKALAEIKEIEYHFNSLYDHSVGVCDALGNEVSRMRRALEAALKLPLADSRIAATDWRDGWNHALGAVRSAIEHALGPFAPEDGKHET